MATAKIGGSVSESDFVDTESSEMKNTCTHCCNQIDGPMEPCAVCGRSFHGECLSGEKFGVQVCPKCEKSGIQKVSLHMLFALRKDFNGLRESHRDTISKQQRKQSNLEVLDGLAQQMSSIEEFGKNIKARNRIAVRSFQCLTVLIIFAFVVICYYRYYPQDIVERIVFMSPFFITPFVAFYIHQLVSYYFDQKLLKNQQKLAILKLEKKKILDNVMETETFKEAKLILDKHAPEKMQTPGPNQEIRNRVHIQALPETPRTSHSMVAAPQRLLPGTIPPYNPSGMTALLNLITGTGPNNCMALICKSCSGHNGMVLIEDFKSTAFTCCYCQFHHPAAEQQQVTPNLQVPSPATDNETAES